MTQKERLLRLAELLSAPPELIEYVAAGGLTEEHVAICFLLAQGANKLDAYARLLESLDCATEAAQLRAQAVADRAPWEALMRLADARIAELAEQEASA